MENKRQDDETTRDLTAALAAVRRAAETRFSLAGIPEAARVRDLVARAPDSWKALAPEDAFFLFEIDRAAAARAEPRRLAEAYCAGLGATAPEWWGIPGSTDTAAAAHLVALGRAALPCLITRFDDARPLPYHRSEAATASAELAWTVADLAAGLAAAIAGIGYEHRAAPSERAARRRELEHTLAS
jgi:hypothetical protein